MPKNASVADTIFRTAKNPSIATTIRKLNNIIQKGMSMPNGNNCEFQISFFRNGNLLAKTEFTPDREATVELIDAINNNEELRRKGFRAAPITRGNGGVAIAQPVRIG